MRGAIFFRYSQSREFVTRARAEWSNLTVKQHVQLLLDDIRKPDTNLRRVLAVCRLRTFYPGLAREAILDAVHHYRDIPRLDNVWTPPLFKAIAPNACPEIDLACMKLLQRIRKDDHRVNHFWLSGSDVLDYLIWRHAYRKECAAFVNFMVRSNDANARYFDKYVHKID